ncbi:testis-specific zinc finger protein topi isoform X2 [Rhagoletis pomonella]|uniref:testis-specific zinc finger protein topi isoform X2 n=1 Tax=Rhagoletis pomonella TaxID=28610 RepID=UPI001783E96E|nr:testis-specific zinc finger protein topi isoform X2 [Rhagoletis pomonella]
MMNTSEEEFTNSDAWLSEQLFAQLKEFNSDYREKSMPDTSAAFMFPSGSLNCLREYEPQDLTKARIDNFESVFKLPTPTNITPFDMNDVLDLSNIAGRGSDAALLDLVGTIPLTPFTAPVAESSIMVTETPKQIVETFDATEDELKLLKYLESQPQSNQFVALDTKLYIPPESPATAYRIVKCSNCNCLFDIISFQSHICDYDEHHNLIIPPSSTSTPVNKPIKEEPILPLEPACIRLLRENQIRIRRFLKDELKYDVNASINNNITNSNNTIGSNTSNGATGSNSSNNNSKKQDGPHECTLCERKFVHASGLLRHMEKHAMDLIPTPGASSGGKTAASQGSSLQSVNGLRVVIKCTLCGRIFFEPYAAFNHLCSHFPGSMKEEKEFDNCAEIPYESYVDDAMNFLLTEAKSSSGALTNYEDKPPMYLKMVILSCILQCEFCDFVFSEVSYLFVHSAFHLPERRFECFACDIHVRTSKEICAHWQAECVFTRENLKVHQATLQRYFVCNVCENKFQSLDLLHEHRYTAYHFFPRLNKCLGVLQLPCEYCDVVFEYAQECVAHYEEKHYKKYKRDKDGTGSSSKTRQYLCDMCGKSYTQSSHLWQHLRFHQGVKPFACKEPGCTRKFTIRPDLNDHIRKCHTGERPYHCLVCGKRFLTGSVFYQHRLIHRGERRYECEECGKRFYRADALKNHQRIHTGEKPFGCLFCTKNFRQRGDRDKHIRARHSHLDANARLMMQMQKLQLEAAAAAASAQVAVQQQQANTVLMSGMPTVAPTLLSMPSASNDIISSLEPSLDPNEVVMIGNVAFPKSMFESIIPDIDEESALRAMEQLQ